VEMFDVGGGVVQILFFWRNRRRRGPKRLRDDSLAESTLKSATPQPMITKSVTISREINYIHPLMN
jgi:hypothetical protein